MEHIDAINRYCQGILSGEVLACQTVSQAVQRFRSDLERQGDDDFPYEFDVEAAERVCHFFPTILRHSIGKSAGEPFELSQFQKFITANLFGWKRADGMRRFRRAHISMGRKNGKSTWVSGLQLYLAIADGEAGAHVFNAATKREQANIIFDECSRMVQASWNLSRHAKITKHKIEFKFCNAEIRPVSSDKPFDGLSPHGVFFDELHAWAEHHRKFYDTMTTGSGYRTQPLQMSITTAGDDHSLIYLEETNYVRGILAGTFKDEEMFGIIYELDEDDDLLDIRNYPKANPNMPLTPSQDYIEQQIREAMEKPQALSRLKRYHANRLVSSTEAAFTDAQWKAAMGPLSDWRQAVSICAGFDIGGQDDLASYGLCAKFPTGEMITIEREDGVLEEVERYVYELRTKSYIATGTKRDLSLEPWRTWIEQGKLIAAKHVIAALKADLLKDCWDLGVQMVAFDPYSARQLAEELEFEGIKIVKMPQNCAQYNEPIKQMMHLLTDGGLTPDENDPLLRWAAGNATMISDRQGRYMFDKSSSRDKIDPIVAGTMAYRMAALSKTFSGSLFLT